jgi:hypothetical protein
MHRRATRMARGLLVVACGALSGCGGGDASTEPTASTTSIATRLLGVRVITATTTVAAQLRTGAAPASVGGATITVQRVGALIAGGSSQLRVTSTVPFTRAVVAIDGTDDYYEASFPTPVTDAVLLVTVLQAPPSVTFALRVAAGAGASLSTYVSESVTLTRAGAGLVQASVSWIGASDVDLALVEPGGREIYYGAPTSPTGGRLDLDSNTGCALPLDNRNTENISYATGVTPPAGQYVLRINFWSACEETAPTAYVVTLVVRGNVQTFIGTLRGAGNGGGAGAGIEVTRFTF